MSFGVTAFFFSEIIREGNISKDCEIYIFIDLIYLLRLYHVSC